MRRPTRRSSLTVVIVVVAAVAEKPLLHGEVVSSRCVDDKVNVEGVARRGKPRK